MNLKNPQNIVFAGFFMVIKSVEMPRKALVFYGSRQIIGSILNVGVIKKL